MYCARFKGIGCPKITSLLAFKFLYKKDKFMLMRSENAMLNSRNMYGEVFEQNCHV